MSNDKPWLLTGPQYSTNLGRWLRKYARKSGTPPKAFIHKETGRTFLFLAGYGDFSKTTFTFGHWIHCIITHGSTTGQGPHENLDPNDFRPDPTFWDRYTDVGICALDPEHQHYSYRWVYKEGDPETQLPGDPVSIRECRFCQLVQRHYVWDQQVIQRKKEWF